MANYSSINEYQDYIKNNSEPGNNLLPGFFYSFQYDYRSNTNDIINEDISSYDARPLAFIFDGDAKMKKGINLHFLPPEYRYKWVNFLRASFSNAFENNRRITLPPSLITGIDKKALFAYRQYSINKIRNPRLIPNNKVIELIKYVPNSHDSKTPSQIFKAFRSYIPK